MGKLFSFVVSVMVMGLTVLLLFLVAICGLRALTLVPSMRVLMAQSAIEAAGEDDIPAVCPEVPPAERVVVPAGPPVVVPVCTPTCPPPPPPPPPACPSGMIVHVVVKGDTLFALARRFYVTVETIKVTNHLRSSVIVVGQRLLIPVGVVVCPTECPPVCVPICPPVCVTATPCPPVCVPICPPVCVTATPCPPVCIPICPPVCVTATPCPPVCVPICPPVCPDP